MNSWPDLMEFKVSVITAAYNSEKHIARTIQSVQTQAYQNWEMIIVDDGSTDNTCEIIREFSSSDPRIMLLMHKENQGPGAARTKALRSSTGRFVAYLDSDDIWKANKIERQVKFMLDNGYGFSCTSYEIINDAGEPKDKEIHMLPKLDYIGFLKNNLLQTVGIMVDTEKIDKELLVMPDLRRRQDAATWLRILKSGYDCYGLDEILAEYRRTKKSLSSNKFKSAISTWHLYRDVEHLPLPFCCYCFARYVILAVWKRIYILNKSTAFSEKT